MFQNITKEFQNIFRTLRGHGKLSEKNVEEAIHKIRISLLAADVNVGVVRDFIATVKEKSLGSRVLESLTPDQQFIKIVNEELIQVMGEAGDLSFAFKPPVVVMCVGLQGSGKTTTVAKLAKHLQKLGRKSYLVPADLKRPAAIEQLKVLGRQIGVEVHDSSPLSSPEDVVGQALTRASGLGFDIVLIDTAGRLHVDDEMMQEVARVAKRANPHHILFVADAMTGQDAVKSAKAFSEGLNLTGVILTKLDGDARGGAALSIRKVTGCPIFFAGVGEKIGDFEKFWPERMASRILGMGDVLSLIESATEKIDQEKAGELVERALTNRFSLEDLKSQFENIGKMGSMGKVLGMMPGIGSLKGKFDDVDFEAEIKKKIAIINSMTLKERRYPKILNGSRRKRIAVGSGTDVSMVNKLLREFEMMQKMMKGFKKGGMKDMLKMANLIGR